MSLFTRRETVWVCPQCGQLGLAFPTHSAATSDFFATHLPVCETSKTLTAMTDRLNERDAEITAREQALAAEAEAPDPDLVALAQQMAEDKIHSCIHCGGYHLRKACPRVRRMQGVLPNELHAVEYFREWDQSAVVWPEDLAPLVPPAKEE